MTAIWYACPSLRCHKQPVILYNVFSVLMLTSSLFSLSCFTGSRWNQRIKGKQRWKGEINTNMVESLHTEDVLLSENIALPPEIIYSMHAVCHYHLWLYLDWIFTLLQLILPSGRGWFPRGQRGDGSEGWRRRQRSFRWQRRRWAWGAKRSDGSTRRKWPFWYFWREGT